MVLEIKIIQVKKICVLMHDKKHNLKKFNNKILKKVYFISPDKIKKKIFKKNLRTVVGFHTRNVPHKGHEWIHNFGNKKSFFEALRQKGLIIEDYNKDQYIIKNLINNEELF